MINLHDGHLASCLCCKNFYTNDASPGYSEWTPGESMSIYCLRGHFDFDEYNATEMFQRLHDLGQTCVDFQPRRALGQDGG